MSTLKANTLLDTSGNPLTRVLQIVSVVKTDTASNSTGSAQSTYWNYNNSSLRCQITASSASSKFFITGQVSMTANSAIFVVVRDDGTDLTGMTATGTGSARVPCHAGVYSSTDTQAIQTAAISGMITAGDTNQHTFHYAFKHSSGSTQTIFMNRSQNDGDGSDRSRACSSLTVMEIAA
tara:strand:+ start:905 stop:1441 length:537 start_codon:yes stop_codon:yes gene_type:complete